MRQVMNLTTSMRSLVWGIHLPTSVAGPEHIVWAEEDTGFARATGRMLHVDDEERLVTWIGWFEGNVPPPKCPSIAEKDATR